MTEYSSTRTLVKSPPELWNELSDAPTLARHLGAFGEIRITRLDPETTVAWEGDRARGTVSIEPSGWGTKVTLTAAPEATEPAAPQPEAVAEPEPEPLGVTVESPAVPEPEPARPGFLARLFRRGAPPAPQADPEPIAVAPAAPAASAPVAPEPPAPAPEPALDDAQSVLDATLEHLGSAHHRPFSRG